MKTQFIALCVLIMCSLIPNSAFSEDSVPAPLTVIEELVVADFNSGIKPNNVGGDFGSWNYDPQDTSQGCVMDFGPFDAQKLPEGKCMKLTYDVQSSNPAFNGFWMKLEGIDVSKYNRLRMYVKGDDKSNFTSRFKIELKNALGKRAIYFVKGITNEWSEVVIDFKKTTAITDWTNMSEFTIVFSDLVATYKEGSLYVDSIAFLVVEE